MLIPIKSGSGLKLDHVGSKTRSLDQILEKHCVCSRGRSSEAKFMKLCQNVYSYLDQVQNWVMLGKQVGHLVKSKKSLVYTLKDTVFDPKFMKLCQNINH